MADFEIMRKKAAELKEQLNDLHAKGNTFIISEAIVDSGKPNGFFGKIK